MKNRKFVVSLVLAFLVYGALIVYSDFGKLQSALSYAISPMSLLVLGLVSINYGIRFLRWEWCLRQKNIVVHPYGSLLIFLSGFTMSITPGKLGEALKSSLMRQTFQVPISSTLPIVFIERLVDVLGLLLLCCGGLFYEPSLRMWVFMAVVIMAFLVFSLQSQFLLKSILFLFQIMNLSKYASDFQTAWTSMRHFLQWRRLSFLVLISSLSWCLEGVAAWCLASAIQNFSLDWSALGPTVFVYSSTTLAGAVSFLPGGLGVTEISMISLLRFFNIVSNVEQASAVTILIRFFTLWWGVGVGGASFVLYKRYQHRFSLSGLEVHNEL